MYEGLYKALIEGEIMKGITSVTKVFMKSEEYKRLCKKYRTTDLILFPISMDALVESIIEEDEEKPIGRIMDEAIAMVLRGDVPMLKIHEHNAAEYINMRNRYLECDYEMRAKEANLIRGSIVNEGGIELINDERFIGKIEVHNRRIYRAYKEYLSKMR